MMSSCRPANSERSPASSAIAVTLLALLTCCAGRAAEAGAAKPRRKKWTYADSQSLGLARKWEQLREIVLHAEDGSAWSWAVVYYSMRDPRWTAARCVERLRAWLKKHPNPTEKQLENWDHTLREYVTCRDKLLGARLGAELLADKDDDVARVGCNILRWVGDRHADRALLKAALKRSAGVRSTAVFALAKLRGPGPLPSVSDEELCQLVELLVSRPKMVPVEYGMSALPETLPPKYRARLWHAFFKALRRKNRPWGYPSDFYEDAMHKPAWPASEEERRVVRSYLRGSDADMRGWAAYYLAKWQDLPSYPKIAELLRDGDPEVRELAANGVSWHSTPQFVPALRPLLQDKNRKVVAAAAAAIGICGDQKSVPQLVELLRHKDIYVVSRAAVGLKGNKRVVGNPEVRARLKAILSKRPIPDNDWNEYWEIAWALVALCTREDLPAIKSMAKGFGQGQLLTAARDRLDPEAARRRKLKKEADSEQGWPTLYAAHRGDSKAAARLCARLKVCDGIGDINAAVSTCLRALYFNQREVGVKQVRELIHWDRSWISELPAHAAGRFKDKRLTPELTRAIRRSDVSLGTRIWALGEIGEERAVSALVEVGLDPRWVVSVTHRRDAYPTPWYKGWAEADNVLLVTATSEALEKITGHEILERDPVKLARAWRAHLAKKLR
jgi:HEAT repeat protein